MIHNLLCHPHLVDHYRSLLVDERYLTISPVWTDPATVKDILRKLLFGDLENPEELVENVLAEAQERRIVYDNTSRSQNRLTQDSRPPRERLSTSIQATGRQVNPATASPWDSTVGREYGLADAVPRTEYTSRTSRGNTNEFHAQMSPRTTNYPNEYANQNQYGNNGY
jgi:hypothetical protein